MPEDLPIYSDSNLRTRLQFADIEKLRGRTTPAVWEKADHYIAAMEGAANVSEARKVAAQPAKQSLLDAHGLLFSGKEGAGGLRQSSIVPAYRGQDCPDPQFIGRSLDNFFNWFSAESVSELHPIEKAALVLTRIVDIWPFEFGNLTAAVVLANAVLGQAGFSPFYVLPEHMKEFNTIVAQAITIETQPLVNAIHRTLKREMEGFEHR